MSHPQSAIIPDHAQAGIFIEADISDGRNEDIKSACRLLWIFGQTENPFSK